MKKHPCLDAHEKRHIRLERVGVRIWEFLEQQGETPLEHVVRRFSRKTPAPLVEEAVQWLVANDYAALRKASGRTLVRSNGSSPAGRIE
jgi:hypothetical protein